MRPGQKIRWIGFNHGGEAGSGYRSFRGTIESVEGDVAQVGNCSIRVRRLDKMEWVSTPDVRVLLNAGVRVTA